MAFGVQQHLAVTICKDPDDATNQGFIYSYPEFKPLEISKAVVVSNGTTSGKSTVDLILKDQDGNQFVVMLTGALIKSIPC